MDLREDLQPGVRAPLLGAPDGGDHQHLFPSPRLPGQLRDPRHRLDRPRPAPVQDVVGAEQDRRERGDPRVGAGSAVAARRDRCASGSDASESSTPSARSRAAHAPASPNNRGSTARSRGHRARPDEADRGGEQRALALGAVGT